MDSYENGDSERRIILLEDEIEKIKKTLAKSISKQDVFKKIEYLSYPYGLEEWVRQDIEKSEKIKYLRKSITLNKNTGVNQNIKNSFSNDFFDFTCLKFKSGSELLKFAENASPHIKPILFFYGVNQIYSGLIDCILTGSEKQQHGLSMMYDDWFLRIDSRGFFKKLVVVIEILTGSGSIFSPLYWKCSYVSSERYILMMRNSIEENRINLLRLNQNMRNAFHIFADSSQFLNNQILVEYINLFAFSSYSRYNPKFWLNFIKGKEFMFKTMEETYSSIYNFISYFLSQIIEFPSKTSDFKSSLINES